MPHVLMIAIRLSVTSIVALVRNTTYAIQLPVSNPAEYELLVALCISFMKRILGKYGRTVYNILNTFHARTTNTTIQHCPNNNKIPFYIRNF